jgi:hypothetical protein
MLLAAPVGVALAVEVPLPLPVVVADGPALIPPVVAELPRVWLENVVFLLKAVPVPIDDPTPANVVVATTDPVTVVLPEGPAMMIAVAAAEVVDDMVVEVVVAPPTSSNSPV